MYLLKHKNEDVFIIDENLNICSIINEDRIPTLDRLHEISISELTKKFQRWFKYRQLPHYRDTLTSSFHFSLSTLLDNSFCLSLSDNYWFCHVSCKGIKWEDINFYERGYSSAFGRQLALQQPVILIDYNSPDIFTNGFLRKFWQMENGKNYLYKASYYGFEPYMEMFCSKLIEYHNKELDLNILYTLYHVVMINNTPFCKCPSFTNQCLEYVPAFFIMEKGYRTEEDNSYQVFIDNTFQITGLDIQYQLDTMLSLDFLVNNIDRHFYNFGFLRDSDTLEFKSFAPIFDTGTSLLFNIEQKNKPFSCNKIKQIKELSFPFVFSDTIIKQVANDVLCQVMQKTAFEKRIDCMLNNNKMLKEFCR